MEVLIPDPVNLLDRNLTIEDFLELYDVSLTAESILLFYSIGTSIVLLTTTISVRSVVKLNPKESLI